MKRQVISDIPPNEAVQITHALPYNAYILASANGHVYILAKVANERYGWKRLKGPNLWATGDSYNFKTVLEYGVLIGKVYCFDGEYQQDEIIRFLANNF